LLARSNHETRKETFTMSQTEMFWMTTPPLKIHSDASRNPRRLMPVPNEPIEWPRQHDLDDQAHLMECPSCSYDVMRASCNPPDIERAYDDHELGYAGDWLPYMSIERVREELGADGFSVTWPNVVGR